MLPLEIIFVFPPKLAPRLSICRTTGLNNDSIPRHLSIKGTSDISSTELVKYHGRFPTKMGHQEDKKNRKAYNLAKCAARIPQRIHVVFFIAQRGSVARLMYPLWLFILFFAYCGGTLILRTITISDAPFPNTYQSGAGLLYG
jgi:hypothetical protein